jgi:nucleoredoxin
VLLDGCSVEVQDATMAVLKPIAEAAKASGSELLYFAANKSEGAVPQVRKLCGLAEASDKPQLVLLDIPDNGGYYVADPAEVTTESIGAFLAAYKKGGLERKQLSK